MYFTIRAGALLFMAACYSSQSIAQAALSGHISPIPVAVEKRMRLYTWRPGCPVPIRDLRYLTLPYWGYDNKTHQGALIVNKALASEVLFLFQELYKGHFPIERMALMDDFKGKDDAAMAANNTSAFNCRSLTGKPGVFSQHSYGRAIDINTKINPYLTKKQVLPNAGKAFVDRKQSYPGKISKEGLVYKLFTQYNWDWGGNWFDLQDYQHFEKRAHGKKRNPHGS